MTQFTRYISSPLGWLELKSTENELTAVRFARKTGLNSNEQPPILLQAQLQLEEYFSGHRKDFQLQLKPEGTEFQQRIWKLVTQVKFGETSSYLEIAVKSGSKKNTRAVGLANGKNPIPIIIPCHRIIGVSGKLTGYSGGIDRKRWLLKHELLNTPNKSRLF